MKLIKGRPFEVNGTSLVPMKAECFDCGKVFKLAIETEMVECLWNNLAPVACWRCMQSDWINLMMGEMDNPFVFERINMS